MTVDCLTKRTKVAPTYSTVDSRGVAKIIRDVVWKDTGYPEMWYSNRGAQFVSSFQKELNELLGNRMNPSTAYHPQTGGQTERLNQEIEKYLRLFVNFRQDDWVDWLPLAEFALNDRVNISTGFSPFFLTHRFHPRSGVEPPRESVRSQPAADFVRDLQKARDKAQAALQKAASDMKRFYN